MNRTSVIFCSISLLLFVGISAAAYPFAALNKKTLEASRTPTDAESLPDVNLGDFGTVAVAELMNYYLENPPAAPTPGAAPPRRLKFQGC